MLFRNNPLISVDGIMTSLGKKCFDILFPPKFTGVSLRLIPLTQVRLYVVAADRPRFSSDCLA